MNRLLLISTTLISTLSYSQPEVGTIKVKKAKEKTAFESFMRETPDTTRFSLFSCLLFCGCPPLPSPVRHTWIMTGAGNSNGWYGELGIEQIILWHYVHVGILGKYHQYQGAKLRTYIQGDIDPLGERLGFSAGFSHNFSLNNSVKNTMEPYIGFRLDRRFLSHFQMNLGYAFSYGKKNEINTSSNALSIGLWCRL
ncbi:MAG: hypothetical protein GC180_02825 [Bacteroidetes bacterium]|nr:hypothetical protein [Bacteroidota bacterium]